MIPWAILFLLLSPCASLSNDVRIRSLQEMLSVTVVVSLDEYPEEISWSLTSFDRTTTVASNSYTAIDSFQTKSTTVDLIQGEQYIFRIEDVFGDGIIAPGFYAIYASAVSFTTDTQLLRNDEFITTAEEHVITVPTGGPLTTQPSASPVGQPTSGVIENCVENPEEEGFWQRLDQRDQTNPHFLNDQAVFGLSHTICSQHKSYADCTNEASEDCQWVFLSASERRGYCRVDPIAKCIETGDCQCHTHDFHGGGDDLGNGILFHAPISITKADIANVHQVTAHETYSTPTNQDPQHPQDADFFISRVDFTGRTLQYTFDTDLDVQEATILFKLHYLYMDVPIQGQLWEGMGLSVRIDTSANTLAINERTYELSTPLKKWTCTQVAITRQTLYVNNVPYTRTGEDTVDESGNSFTMGPFSGELFDVRIYEGTLNESELYQVGARCAAVQDPFALRATQDIEAPYLFRGCDPSFYLPGGEGGDFPANGQQTYGSGPFATLWLSPRDDSFSGELVDTPEGAFDEEYYFQTNKVLQYTWEKFLFETGMIAFNQAPYRSWDNSNQVPIWSETLWNNPCRYMHNLNNAWQHPIWGGALGKWTVEENGLGDPNAVFDLGDLYKTRGGEWAGLTFIVHEMFHGTQGSMIPTFDTPGSLWLAESTAEFGADVTFPAAEKIVAPLTTSPAYPLGLDHERDLDRSSHFFTEALSLHNAVRGGHLYGSWMLWWFLTEHVGLAGIVGEMYALWSEYRAFNNGELLLVRILVEQHGLDFGDVWACFAAHLRTWDFPRFGQHYAQAEQDDFTVLLNNPDVQPPIPPGTTLEGRKTQVEIDPSSGTLGFFASGPSNLRPGPNGWNCLSMRNVEAGKFVTIQVRWDDGMGFDSQVSPSRLPSQQAGCDEDPRFYNNVVVAHNEATGQRRYWKLRGKRPQALSIQIGDEGPETIHILLVVTPPTDYVGASYWDENDFLVRVSPIPVYGYEYSVSVANTGDASQAPAEKQYGLMRFDSSTAGFWPVECTCIDDPSNPSNPSNCIRPTFETLQDTLVPATPVPTPEPTPEPTPDPTVALTPAPTPEPSPEPTPEPTPVPTPEPTLDPSSAPSETPTQMQSDTPTVQHSDLPTTYPTLQPSVEPTLQPSGWPTTDPSLAPTLSPTLAPTFGPTVTRSDVPTSSPTTVPTLAHSVAPTLAHSVAPTLAVSSAPTVQGSSVPSAAPTQNPTTGPSAPPTQNPSTSPSAHPTLVPTIPPSSFPSRLPSVAPTSGPPTLAPSQQPTPQPTPVPTPIPTLPGDTGAPSPGPTTGAPSLAPSFTPTLADSSAPTIQDSSVPSAAPTQNPTPDPSTLPTLVPSGSPSGLPSRFPSLAPTTARPTTTPSVKPTTGVPTSAPSLEPTPLPTPVPTPIPTLPGDTGAPSPLPTTATPSRATSTPTSRPSSDAPTRNPTNVPTPLPTTPSPTTAAPVTTLTPTTSTSMLPSQQPSFAMDGNEPQPTLRPTRRRPPSFCFSAKSLVVVRDDNDDNRREVAMEELRIGDWVLVGDNRFEQVYSFGHYHQTLETDYLRIHTNAHSQPLELTPDHMVFLYDNDDSVAAPVPASVLKVGSRLSSSSSSSLSIVVAVVQRIEVVTRRGAYAPFTFSGVLVVNGVLSSNYVVLEPDTVLFRGWLSHQWMAHAFVAPHRTVCRLSPSYWCVVTERYSDRGVSLWLDWPNQRLLPLFVVNNNNNDNNDKNQRLLLSLFSWILLLPTLPILVLFRIVDETTVVLLRGWWLILAVSVLLLAAQQQRRRRRIHGIKLSWKLKRP